MRQYEQKTEGKKKTLEADSQRPQIWNYHTYTVKLC